MALHFLIEDAGAAGPGDVVRLTGAEAHHAAAVRRIRVGEDVTVGDGRGVWLTGTVSAAAPKEVSVEVSTRAEVPAASPRTVLVQALAKGDRDELAVQAATELGVDAIMPWQAARSVSRWEGPKVAKGVARWETIAREAAKQAHRPWLAELHQPVSTRQLAALAQNARMLVLEPTASVALSRIEIDAADASDVILVVGPEGGISPEELDLLQSAGATLVRLGDTVLRTSTAGPAALAVVNAALGRW
ncbi:MULTISPECIES: 16S rRNA (uracil(1498)-N(3))-methyltransferase [Microbacterium]|uniref:Ribosomal RNA small subunit methyltransferase E n=1 Tax=Microbacterium aquilitoris TaxID=3067307 RepID=A0ABU3GM35_9MICO|nr:MULTISPECIES: 16S rRNA (uracil(1498)-N(3))-methyltransferase [unclassified Microbacterium]MDT3331460.1 16S rRNA (uracil(1498)-N(3))-methyltransferase [Microbacterium sp. KSW-18]MDT3343789.1 16S rRNA (uracil(1498)-N(3))-methyltransferase [Microbacterium sp. KSW2-22]SDH03871.1 16S rRNA (uracil1498-N3)-methyltransferase [Microbacterium sp. 77mftsu3.1]